MTGNMNEVRTPSIRKLIFHLLQFKMLMKQDLLGFLLRWPLLMAIQAIGVIVYVLSLGAKVRLMLRQLRNSFEDRVDSKGKAIFVTGKTLLSPHIIHVRVICCTKLLT